MDLTPIKVRGRRKRKSLHDSNDGAPPKNTPRPRKVARLNLAGLQALKTRKIRKDLNLSYLEQLPTELVQVIFEYANNISMPMSSPILCGKLSHAKIYHHFAVNMLSVHANQEDETNDTASAASVSRLLECKWMTWDVMKSVTLELHERACAHAHSRDTTNEETTSEEEQQQQQEVLPPNFTSPQEQGTLPYLNLHPTTQLPRKLLQGPWLPSKTSYLQYLIWSQCRINWTSSSRGELATAGLLNAISTHSHLAAALLLSPTVNVVPDTATLRSAVMDHGCDVTIIFYILVAALRAHLLSRTEGGVGVTDVGFRDAALWSWGGRARDAGNDGGRWLLETLRFLGDFALRGGGWDEGVWAEVVRSCGRVEDGVRVLEGVPVTSAEVDGGGGGGDTVGRV